MVSSACLALQVVFQHALQQVSRGGDIPACIAGGIPVCLATGLQGGGVPGLGGLLPGGAWSGGVCFQGAAPGGWVWGGSASRGLLPGGGSAPRGVPGSRGCSQGGGLVSSACTEADPPRERRLLLRTVRIPLECILVPNIFIDYYICKIIQPECALM